MECPKLVTALMFLPEMEIVELLHPAPKHSMNHVLSGVMGSISIAFWIIVFTPQIYECYSRKSSEGLSLAFVVLWLVGDLFNVAGALLQHVLPTMTILAVYYTVADLVLLIECIIYRNNPSPPPENEPLLSETAEQRSERRDKEFRSATTRYVIYILCVFAFGAAGYLVSASSAPPPSVDPPVENPISFWGQVNGWICAILYLGSRVPQIKLNYDRKSTDGISLLFFMFAVFGNITYVISILAAGISKHDLILNASWLAGSLGTLFLDFVIFFQFVIYRS